MAISKELRVPSNPSFSKSISGDHQMRKLKLRNNQKGFTLVEVIVVAIIVAALAAVAIPLYNNYVTTSKNNMAANTAGAVASFIGACIGLGGEPGGVTTTSQKSAGLKVTCLEAGKTTALNGSTIQVPDGVNISITGKTSGSQVLANGSEPTSAATADSPNQAYSF